MTCGRCGDYHDNDGDCVKDEDNAAGASPDLDESAAERDLGEFHRQREIELVPARVQLTQPDGAVVAQLERTALQEEAAVVADNEGVHTLPTAR